MHIKVLKSWILRVAVFGLLINEPLLSPSVAISQDTNFSSPITTLQDDKPLPSDFIEIFQDQTVLSLITTLRDIDNSERQSPYERCVSHGISIFDSNCELKEEFEEIAQFLPSTDNIPAISYLSNNELVRLEETLEKLIELETKSVFPLIRLLQDDSQLLRESAIYALSEISRSSILDRSSKLARLGIEQSLLEVLANDESPSVRDSAAFALARIEPRSEVIDALIKTLFDNQKPTKVRQHAGQLLSEISLKNMSSASVKFLVEETRNLDSVFWKNGAVNSRLVQRYCVYAQGIISDHNVAYIISKEEMSHPSETCDFLPGKVPVRDLYQAIKKMLFGNG